MTGGARHAGRVRGGAVEHFGAVPAEVESGHDGGGVGAEGDAEVLVDVLVGTLGGLRAGIRAQGGLVLALHRDGAATPLGGRGAGTVAFSASSGPSWSVCWA